MKCENCGEPHTGIYGSGRFCSAICARGFSTKAKRDDINKAVSAKLKTRTTIELVCLGCGNTFSFLTRGSRINKYCSVACRPSVNTKGMTWTVDDSSKMGGLRDGGGRAKVFEYRNKFGEVSYLNKDEIEVATVLDSLPITWQRNTKGFQYTTKEGVARKYYPDFYVEDLDCYVEYKGWVTAEMKHKMDDATLNNDFRLVIVYSDSKRYRDLGLSLSAIRQAPNLLLESLTDSK